MYGLGPRVQYASGFKVCYSSGFRVSVDAWGLRVIRAMIRHFGWLHG